MSEQRSPQIEPAPKGLKVILVSFTLLCIIGMVSAWDLVEVFRMTHVAPESHKSFCNISEKMNCDQVALHDEFSVVAGTPVAVWAVAGFAFVALLSLLSLSLSRRQFGLGFLFLFGSLFLVVSGWLIYVMHFEIGSWCIVCLAIDVINVSLFGLSIGAVILSGTTPLKAVARDFAVTFKTPALLLGIGLTGGATLAGAWLYGQNLQDWIAETRAAQKNVEKKAEGNEVPQVLYVSQKNEQLEEKTWSPKTQDTPQEQACAEKEVKTEGPAIVQVGVSPEGYPWKGAQNPVLEIHEFTDFQCPHCRRAHMLINKLVARYPDRIRVYHRNYPLDNTCNTMLDRPFHPRACELARIAVCAGQQGRFWEMDDYLFHHAQEIASDKIASDKIAKALELDMGKFDCCMGDTQTVVPIEADIEVAIGLGLRGTPAYVINGEIYYGKIPDEALGVLDVLKP